MMVWISFLACLVSHPTHCQQITSDWIDLPVTCKEGAGAVATAWEDIQLRHYTIKKIECWL